MKKTLLKLICFALTVFMIFGMVGCGSEKTTSVNEDMGDFDLDFGTDSTQTDATQSGSDAGTGNDANANDAASKGNANVTTTTEDLDKLSWSQLLAKMPKELRGTTITIASWNPAKEVTGAESVIANFEKLTGIKVKWNVVSYDGYEEKIAALVNSNSSPDLIRYYAPSIHRMYLCQDVKTATGQDFKGDIWDSRVTSQYTIKGKIYGVNLKNTFVQQPKVLMYRKSVVENVGIEDPYVIWKRGEWTWDKFLEICKEFQENTSSTSGYDPWITNVGIDLLDFSGIEMFKFDGSKYTNNLKDAEVYKALKQMCDLKAAGIVSSAVRDQKVFNKGTTLFMTFNSIANRKTNANLTEIKQENDLYCVPIPAIKGRENVQNFSELEAYGIPKGAKNPGAVYYFLRYYLDANNYDANAFFVNKQAYEVYQDAMNKSEFYIATRDQLLDVVTETTGGIAGLSDYIRLGGSATQLQKELDSINPTFELAVKKGNEALAKFK